MGATAFIMIGVGVLLLVGVILLIGGGWGWVKSKPTQEENLAVQGQPGYGQQGASGPGYAQSGNGQSGQPQAQAEGGSSTAAKVAAGALATMAVIYTLETIEPGFTADAAGNVLNGAGK